MWSGLRKYQDRGLAVIAVHSKQDAEKVGAFLAKKPLAIPVAVDTGETAKRYGVESWPSFVLIDRAGNVVAAPSNLPPSEAKIEKLLPVLAVEGLRGGVPLLTHCG